MNYRPVFHYTPKANWMNDPNGLVYDEENKTYHMYYQYCLTLKEDHEKKHWGHAVSRDLVNWTELEPAIAPDRLGSIWSGSAVIDRVNTSGFFGDSVSPGSRIVAFYTYAYGDMSYGFQKQGIAYSLDGGRAFIKYDGNPVIPGFDNRDPKVIWYEDDQYENGGIWIMIIAGMRVRLFTSHNLIDWKFNSEPMMKNGTPLESECPDLFKLGDKWVYCGAGRSYVIGRMEKSNGIFEFVPETDLITPMHGCDDMYAAQTFYNAPDRRVGIYWLIDKTSEQIPGKPYDGALSFPVEYKLINNRLCIYPVKELESLRKGVLFETRNAKSNHFSIDIEGKLLDIEVHFKELSQRFGFKLITEVSSLDIVYDREIMKLIIDKNHVSSIAKGRNEIDLKPDKEGSIRLRIMLDTSILDVFGNHGEASYMSFIYPDKPIKELVFFGENGISVDYLTVYEIGRD